MVKYEDGSDPEFSGKSGSHVHFRPRFLLRCNGIRHKFVKNNVREPGKTGVISKYRVDEPFISDPPANPAKSTFALWYTYVVQLDVSASEARRDSAKPAAARHVKLAAARHVNCVTLPNCISSQQRFTYKSTNNITPFNNDRQTSSKARSTGVALCRYD